MKSPFAQSRFPNCNKLGSVLGAIVSALLLPANSLTAQENEFKQYHATTAGGEIAGDIALQCRDGAVESLVLTLRNLSSSEDCVVRIFDRRRDTIVASVQILDGDWKEIAWRSRPAPFHEWRSATDVVVPRSGFRQWFLPLADLVDGTRHFYGERAGRVDLSVLFQVAKQEEQGRAGQFRIVSLRFFDYHVKLSAELLRNRDVLTPDPSMLRFIDKSVIAPNTIDQLREAVALGKLRFADLNLEGRVAKPAELGKRLSEIREFLTAEVERTASHLRDPDLPVVPFKSQFGATVRVSDGRYLGILFHSASGPVARIAAYEWLPTQKPRPLDIGKDGKRIAPMVDSASWSPKRTLYQIEFSSEGKFNSLHIREPFEEFLGVREDGSLQKYSRKSGEGQEYSLEVDAAGQVQAEQGRWQ